MANLLEVLPEYVLYWLVQRGTERTLTEHEVLLKEGQKNDCLYIVLDGLFSVVVTKAANKQLEHRGPGSVLGEDSFFTDGLPSSTVIAQEPSLVLELPRTLLKDKMQYDHQYASDFYKALLTTMS